MNSYVILMQVKIGTNEWRVLDKIADLCSNLKIKTFIPISRTDDESRIDCYVLDVDTEKDKLLQQWRLHFPGCAILIDHFFDVNEGFFVRKAAEIWSYSVEKKLSMGDLEMHMRRHLIHYILNSCQYNYTKEALFHLNCATKFVEQLKTNVR